jgi:hypothetical protein
MNKYILFIFLFCSCASIKKNKKTSEVTESVKTSSIKIEESTQENISNFISSKSIDKDLFEIVQEETIISRKTIDSAGIQIIVPEIKIKKTIYTSIKEKEIVNLDTTRKEITSLQIVQKDSSSVNKTEETLDLEKESEGIKVIEEIISGIIGGGIWKSVIFVIIALILIVVLIKKLKRKENEKIN